MPGRLLLEPWLDFIERGRAPWLKAAATRGERTSTFEPGGKLAPEDDMTHYVFGLDMA
jgi:hypothetical protein